MIFKDGNFFILDSETGVRADDISPENLEALGGPFCVSLECYEKTNMLIPVLEEYVGNDIVSVNGFYKMARHFKQNPSMLVKAHQSITPAIAGTLIDIADKIKVRTESLRIRYDLSDYVAGNPTAFAAYEAQKEKGGLSLNVENETLKQNKETDKLFIQLPADSLITSYIDENVAPMPNMNQVCAPYPSQLYKTWYIGKILDVPLDRRLKEISRAVAALRELKFEMASPEVLMRDFKVISREYVFGNPDNNDIGIRENERDYYEALIAFIKHHIALFNKATMSDASDEEINEKSKKDFDTCNLPKRLEAYLRKLLYTITSYHYAHTGRFMLSVSTFSDDEDSGIVRDEEFAIAYVSDEKMSDADVCIHGYIQLSGTTMGASVWAEALVKLCRWGSLKPSILTLGEDNPNVIDLTEFKVHTAVLNISKLEKITDDKGRGLYVKGFANNYFEKDYIAYEMPSVLIVSEMYKNPTDEKKTEEVFSTIAFHEVVNQYRRGNPILSGIEYEQGAFIVDDSIDFLPSVEINIASTIKPYSTDAFIKLCVKHNISQVKGMSYALTNQSILTSFIPTDYDYAQHLASFPAASRSEALYGIWLSAFTSTAQEWDMESLEEFLNMYNEKIYDDFEKLMEHLSGEETQSAQTLATSNLFDGIASDADFFEDDEDEIEEGVIADMYKIYQGDVSKLKFVRILNRKEKEGDASSGRLIGGYSKDAASGDFVFSSINDNVKYDENAQAGTFHQVSLLLLGSAIAEQLDKAPKVVSSNTLVDIYSEASKR